MRPAMSTVRALERMRNDGRTLREIVSDLGYHEGWIATISDILNNKNGCISLERENDLRKRMGLREVSNSGRLRGIDNRVRPSASREQDARRGKLGATWNDVIECGLAFLEGNT